MLSILGKVLIGVGLGFDLLGCLGLVRLPDVYNRLQAATKCITLGTCGILLGVFFYSGMITGIGIKALLCILFLVLTAPVAAHAISKGAHNGGLRMWKGSVTDEYLEDTGKGEGEGGGAAT